MGRGDFPPCTPRRATLDTRHRGGNGVMLLSGGVIAQMGERLNGIQEVGSSILPGSTKERLKAGRFTPPLFIFRTPDKSLPRPTVR